jgi:hypothetical protein
MMIGQQVATNTHLVYVDDYRTGWKEVGHRLGICDANGTPESGNYVMADGYRNTNGIVMPAMRLDGKSIEVYVVDGIVDNVTDAPSLAAALNHFNAPTMDFGAYRFSGKFSVNPGKTHVVYDRMHRSITFNTDRMKDLRGIHDLMARLEFDNGKFMEPLLSRYIYTVKQMPGRKNRGIPVIGYFDLEEYLSIMRDPRSAMFHPAGANGALMYIETGERPGRVVLKEIAENGSCVLSLEGFKSLLDVKKVNSFRPIVVMSMTPFKLPESSNFPWHKVTYGKFTVFCTPMMGKMDMWEHVQGGVNLLSRMM